MVTLIQGDCLEHLRSMPDNSVDSLVTDPPAGISFMGKAWDGDKGGRDQWVAWMTSVMTECLRVLKPGAHGLVWALPRTSHWTATALENAGFEVRDVVTHLFGTGFPKSLDISKAIDKAAGAEREVVGKRSDGRYASSFLETNSQFGEARPNTSKIGEITAPSTDAAKQWAGWGTALKPACEMWVLVRKPLGEKTVAANVLEWGTGGINIDGCRIATTDKVQLTYTRDGQECQWKECGRFKDGQPVSYQMAREGRFPANLILDETVEPLLGDAARFFYVAKASKADKGAGNTHPTVKSSRLMGYLIKLVTPPNGIVLDPFMGSGSTGVAAIAGKFDFIGIEKEADYFRIAKGRIGEGPRE